MYTDILVENRLFNVYTPTLLCMLRCLRHPIFSHWYNTGLCQTDRHRATAYTAAIYRATKSKKKYEGHEL